MNYKDTLNLPKTAFSMKANLAQREPGMLAEWQKNKLYEKIQEITQDRKAFVFYDGPPYANGPIHMGHALNKTLKDIVIKSKLLSGFKVPCVAAWDCHGLPIEVNVEKKFGKPGQKLTPKEFRQKCREYALSQITLQKEAFQRLGVLMDWDHPCTTMDFDYEANIIRSLATIVDKGSLHQGYKPVYWCVDCGSALAEAEVEYKDKHSTAVDVRFDVVDTEVFLARFDQAVDLDLSISIGVPIWTTTPWTLPANQAVCLNPELDYVLVECTLSSSKTHLFLARALLDVVMQRFDILDYTVLANCSGAAVEGLLLQHPFYDRQVPLIMGEHVDAESGTGAVHTAPAHGVEDFLVGQHYDLPVDNPVGPDGCFLKSVSLVGGQHVKKVNQTIVDELIKNKKLLHEAALEHSYPHCWRHKTPLIYRATPQWFIGMQQNNLRNRVMGEIQNVEWVPSWGKARIESMMENRPDWCVSRQRTWCVPMCLIMHKETSQLHPRMVELMEDIASRIEKNGIEAWYDLDLHELIGNEAQDYEKCHDALDVWFDSGVMHACLPATRPEMGFPADLCLEGSDQHRGWFNSSLLTSVIMNDVAPYRQVVTHGFLVDANGRKMSKSLGNVISPDKVIKTLGADILRLWVSATDYSTEISLSDEILKRTADSYRRLRNTARFLLSNLHGFDPQKDLLPAENLLALDRWAIDRAHQVQQDILQAYDRYQFHLIYQKLHNFCVVDMGGFYLDIIKDRQYTTKAESIARLSAQTAMYHILEALVRWLAPILSFTAEEIWQHMPGERAESVFMATWYNALEVLPEDSKMNRDFWAKVSAVRDEVNKVIEKCKAQGTVNSALETDVYVYADAELKSILDNLGEELRFVFITSTASVSDIFNAPETAVATDIENLRIAVSTSSHAKCVRCWQRREDVGSDTAHSEICGRCVENVAGGGEERFYA